MKFVLISILAMMFSGCSRLKCKDQDIKISKDYMVTQECDEIKELDQLEETGGIPNYLIEHVRELGGNVIWTSTNMDLTIRAIAYKCPAPIYQKL